MGKIINTPEGFVRKTIFVDLGENIKAAVLVSERTYGYADMAGVRYREMYNVKEPFDFKTHHFILPKDTLTREGGFYMTSTPERLGKVFTDMCDCVKVRVDYSPDMLVAYDDAVSSMDRQLSLSHEEKTVIFHTEGFLQGQSSAVNRSVIINGFHSVHLRFSFSTLYRRICPDARKKPVLLHGLCV